MTARTASLLALLTLLTLLVRPALAQVRQDSTPLAPIVVTATRTPIATSELGNGVSVLDGDALRRAGVTTVADALRGVPSVALAQAGSYGAQTSLFLRGGESDYVRVLVDGVPLNQAGGFIDLANLTTENVERIEIVRGPSSVLYGSDAMTGVVQIISRRGRGAAQASAEARGGSYGSSLFGAALSAGGSAAAISAGAQREATSGGYAFNNEYANVGASSRLTLTPDARTDVQVALRYHGGVFHYPTDGSGAAADSNQQQRSRQAAISVDAGRHLSSRLEARALLGYVAARDSTDDRPDSPGDTLGVYAYASRANTSRRTADLRANVRASSALLLSFGGALDDERQASRSSYQSSFGPGSGTTDVQRTNRAVYAQALGESGRLAVQAGLRLDDNQQFGTFATWRLGGSLHLARATRLRANAGTAFKEPTFDENYSTGYSIGNPGLVPERSSSVEAGVEQSLAGGRISASVTAFAQRFRDLIQYTFLTAAPTDPNFYNVASARSDGAELEFRAAPARALTLSAQYTYLRTSAQDSGFDGSVFAPGQRLLRRPTHSGSVSAEWRAAPGGTLGARALFVGERDDLDFSTYPAARVALPAYRRLDVWGALCLARMAGGSALALTLRAENVTGATYQEVYGFRTPGRRVLAGARIDAGR